MWGHVLRDCQSLQAVWLVVVFAALVGDIVGGRDVAHQTDGRWCGVVPCWSAAPSKHGVTQMIGATITM